jgi:hypothetical protein
MKKIFPHFALHLGSTVGVIVSIVTLLFTGSLIWSILIGTGMALLIALTLPLYLMRAERNYKKVAAKVSEPKLFYEWIKLVIGNAAVDARIFLTSKHIYLMSLGKNRNIRIKIPKSYVTDAFVEQDLHLHIKYKIKEKLCNVHVVTPFGEEILSKFREHGFLK